MNELVLTVNGLTKKYADFVLDGVSFNVPKGTIVGLIGENGAGKSTTINAILGLIKKDAGEVSLLGNQAEEADYALKEQVGVVFDASNFPECLSPRKLNNVLKNIYAAWDEGVYHSLLKKLSLPLDKSIKQFSKGMKMKLSIAAALSHHSKLLILDEATSGLDPVVRDDILDMFLEFVRDKENSILISSHITSDLEKVADRIVFIHAGRIVFSESKEDLTSRYGLMKCDFGQFERLENGDVIACRRQGDEWSALVADRNAAQEKYPKAHIVPATIDEIMLLYVKGERK
jgi:ABC-2 type transport system ATP-binding protein